MRSYEEIMADLQTATEEEVMALVETLPEHELTVQTLPAGTVIGLKGGFGVPLKLIADAQIEVSSANWILGLWTREKRRRENPSIFAS